VPCLGVKRRARKPDLRPATTAAVPLRLPEHSALQPKKSSVPGERVHHRLCDIEKAVRRARFLRDVAPQIGQPRRHDTMVDHQVVESKLGFVCHPKNSLSIASRGGETTGDLPKNCHLLPFVAVCSRKTVTTVSIHFLPFGGVPASLGSGLSTASPYAHERKSKIPSS
jgi:hypothetical protein